MFPLQLMELLWAVVLAIAIVYLIVSTVLFVFPTIIHHNHEDRVGSVKISAHRGGAGEYIENTMPAFDHAVQIGVNMLEIDVQETKDSVIVVSHDNDMYRATGKRGLISETLYADLPPYSNHLFLQFDRVQCISSQTDFSFVKLDDLFESHRDVVIHIDTKDGKPSLVNSVSELILKHDRLKNTVWGNMTEAKTDLCYSVNHDVTLFFSIRKVILTYLMFYLGVIGFYPMKEAVFDIPMPSTLVDQFSDVLSCWQKVLAHVVNFLMMNRLLFWHLRRRGIKVVVFVLNHEKNFTVAEQYNVDGIMTDFPSRLIKYHNDKESAEAEVGETSQILGKESDD